MQRGAALGAGFGEGERAVRKVEGGEVVAAAELGAFGVGFEVAPVEAAGDHEMEDEEEVVVEAEDDALADAAERADGAAFDGLDAWDGGAKKEGRGDAEVFERLADDAGLQRGEVGGDVGELGHTEILHPTQAQKNAHEWGTRLMLRASR